MCERNVTERVRNELELMTMKTAIVALVGPPCIYIISCCRLCTTDCSTAQRFGSTAQNGECSEYVHRTATPNYRVAMRSYLFSHSNRVISHYGVDFFPMHMRQRKHTHTQRQLVMHSRVSIVISSSFENVSCSQTPRNKITNRMKFCNYFFPTGKYAMVVSARRLTRQWRWMKKFREQLVYE